MKVGKSNIEQIYIRHKDHVFAIGFNYFRNEVDADDIIQETFLKLMKSDKEFESEDHLRNWIMRVAVNECKRVTLSSWFKRKESLEDYTDKLVFSEPEDRDLFDAVMNLPKKYRQVTSVIDENGEEVDVIGNEIDEEFPLDENNEGSVKLEGEGWEIETGFYNPETDDDDQDIAEDQD